MTSCQLPGPHVDSKNVPGSYSALFVFEVGATFCGYFYMLPQYRVALDVRPGVRLTLWLSGSDQHVVDSVTLACGLAFLTLTTCLCFAFRLPIGCIKINDAGRWPGY